MWGGAFIELRSKDVLLDSEWYRGKRSVKSVGMGMTEEDNDLYIAKRTLLPLAFSLVSEVLSL